MAPSPASPPLRSTDALDARASASEGGPPPLLPKVALGDESAVKECVARYGRLVYALASRFLRDARDVEDACQDIFVAVWKNAAAFDPARGGETTFVALIARRRLIDRSRAPSTRPLPSVEELPDVSSSHLENYVDARTAVAALEECSEDQKRVIVLAAFQGLTHEEIARELDLPLGTVKSHYTRGIERIKRALKTHEARR
jgi:RNA polymerase sigma factor (sigma-70 family)